MKYCNRFFEYLYLDNNEGDICICPWMERRKIQSAIGNLMTDNIKDAYNSDFANHLRSTMDDQSFKYCRPEACPFLQNNSLPDITIDEYEKLKRKEHYPTIINLAYDFICNQHCETCRQRVFTPGENYDKQMNIIYEKIAPYLETAKMITASGHGDPFASRYMMRALENLQNSNPDLTVLLETNGVFFDEAHWDRIKHLSKFKLEIVITINSFDEFIYKQISRGGNYEKVLRNLEFISNLRRSGQISIISNSFVIQDRNFREIPSFIKRSFDDYAFDYVVLKPVYQWSTMTEDVYWFKDVLNPCHPYHNEYLEIMQNPICKDSRVFNFAGDTVHKPRPFPGSSALPTEKFPYELIRKDSRVIVYGAGMLGKEYIRQNKETQYCKIVAWVDRCSYETGVLPPNSIGSMSLDSYDVVLIATKTPIFRKQMMETLEGFGVPNDRIVWCKNEE